MGNDKEYNQMELDEEGNKYISPPPKDQSPKGMLFGISVFILFMAVALFLIAMMTNTACEEVSNNYLLLPFVVDHSTQHNVVREMVRVDQYAKFADLYKKLSGRCPPGEIVVYCEESKNLKECNGRLYNKEYIMDKLQPYQTIYARCTQK